MGWLSGGKKLGDGESKDVSLDGKKAGKITKKGKDFELYDTDGKKIKTLKGKSEQQAAEALRKHEERNRKKKGGGGYKGQEQHPRPEGEGRSRGAKKRAAQKQPGSGKNPHLWKDVKKDDNK